MPSKGRAEWNKTYYEKNCEDILHRKKVDFKKAETIKCKCAEFAHYKDVSSSRNRHFKTLTHKVWEKKQDICGMMTKQLKHSQLKAERFIEERLEKKRARTPKDEMKVLLTIINECVDAIDGKNKPKKPEPVNVVVKEVKPIEEDKPYVPPFDPLDLMGTSNSDMEGL